MTPTILTITGPTCSGKSTLEAKLVERHGVGKAISTTTRPMREGEQNGVDYYFMEEDEFDRLKEQGEFLETVEFVGKKYGVTRKECERHAEQGRSVALVCDPEGARQIRAFTDVNGWNRFQVYIDTPSTQALIARFLRRFAAGGMTSEYAAERMHQMLYDEVPNWPQYGPKIGDAKWDMYVSAFNETTESRVILSIMEELEESLLA